MPSIEFTVDVSAIEGLAPAVSRHTLKFASVLGRECVSAIRERLASGGRPRSKTGGLSESFSYRVLQARSNGKFTTGSEVSIDSTHPGARILNEGGVIRPVNARALTIPIGKGAIRGAGGRFRGRGGSARDIPNLVLRRSKAGNLLLGQLPGPKSSGRGTGRKTGKIPPVPPGFIPVFVLKDSVTIPKFGYIDGAMDKAASRLERMAAEDLEREISEATVRR